MTINISNNNAAINSIKQSLNTNTIVSRTSTSSVSSLDNFTKTQSSTIPDTYSLESQEPISPEDAHYMTFLTTNDGTEVHYPPDNASITTKKAWIEAMKKLTPEQRMMASTQLLSYMITQSDGKENLSGYESANIFSRFTTISSMQDLFEGFMVNAKAQLNSGGLSSDLEKGIKETIKVDNIILDVFNKYNKK